MTIKDLRMIVVLPLLFTGCREASHGESQPPSPATAFSTNLDSAPTPSPVLVLARDDLSNVKFARVDAVFERASKGITVIDGALWVPRVQVDLQNTGDSDIERVYLRAVFLDSQDVIRGDPAIDVVNELPSGYKKGPATLIGSVGFTSEYAFLEWRKRPTLRWRFELFAGLSPSGPWKKIGTGLVDGPWGNGVGEFTPVRDELPSPTIPLPPRSQATLTPATEKSDRCEGVAGKYYYQTNVSEARSSRWRSVKGKYQIEVGRDCQFEIVKTGYDNVTYSASEIQRASGRFASPTGGTLDLELSSESGFSLEIRMAFEFPGDGTLTGTWQYLGRDWSRDGLAGTMQGGRRD